VLTARGVFYADHGEPDKAATGFRDALTLSGVGRQGGYWEGLDIYLEVAQRDDVLERLEALRPEDSHPRMLRMILRVHENDFDAAGADADRLEHPQLLSARAAVALLTGDHDEFAALLAERETLPPVIHGHLLALAPTEPALAAELLTLIRETWNDPNDRWHRRWLGEALVRAGEFEEAVAMLESSLDPVFDWQCDGCYWPLLAMAHHRLGNTEAARKYLDSTTYLLGLYEQMPLPQFATVMQSAGVNPQTWLQTVVYHREAMQLIDGFAPNGSRVPSLAPPAGEISPDTP
jgi:hypothetical protein